MHVAVNRVYFGVCLQWWVARKQPIFDWYSIFCWEFTMYWDSTTIYWLQQGWSIQLVIVVFFYYVTCPCSFRTKRHDNLFIYDDDDDCACIPGFDTYLGIKQICPHYSEPSLLERQFRPGPAYVRQMEKVSYTEACRVLLCNDLGKVSRTIVPQSLNSIIWY